MHQPNYQYVSHFWFLTKEVEEAFLPFMFQQQSRVDFYTQIHEIAKIVEKLKKLHQKYNSYQSLKVLIIICVIFFSLYINGFNWQVNFPLACQFLTTAALVTFNPAAVITLNLYLHLYLIFKLIFTIQQNIVSVFTKRVYNHCLYVMKIKLKNIFCIIPISACVCSCNVLTD